MQKTYIYVAKKHHQSTDEEINNSKVSYGRKNLNFYLKNLFSERTLVYDKNKNIYKIGYSKYPATRIDNLKGETGYYFNPVQIIEVESDSYLDLEKEAHNCFFKDRIEGEYFYLNPNQFNDVKWQNFLKNSKCVKIHTEFDEASLKQFPKNGIENNIGLGGLYSKAEGMKLLNKTSMAFDTWVSRYKIQKTMRGSRRMYRIPNDAVKSSSLQKVNTQEQVDIEMEKLVLEHEKEKIAIEKKYLGIISELLGNGYNFGKAMSKI
tara:strand:+ start:63 stop:851 length:789 start_codon:yes stop_codon:yes gene_type:complete